MFFWNIKTKKLSNLYLDMGYNILMLKKGNQKENINF